MKKILKLFDDGNVCVCGLRGRGKDMLMSNVVVRRKLPYVSNVDYGGEFHRLDLQLLDCGKNTYDNFIKGDIKYYEFPYPDYTDIYISDVGVYFPAQYCNELNRKYGHVPTYLALSRQLGQSNTHINVQALNRAWDKLREQSDIYIMCNSCRVLFNGKLVLQVVTLYEKYESAVARVPPYRPPRGYFGRDSKVHVALEKQRYMITWGKIQRRLLIYRNKSNYDTRLFREMLRNGKRSEPKPGPAKPAAAGSGSGSAEK